MKHLILGAALAGALASAGCTPVPQSADELRQVTSRGAVMTAKDSYTVPRSFGAVSGSLRRGADRCLTVTSSQGIMARGPMGMGHVQQIRKHHMTTVRTVDGRTELMIKTRVQGAILVGGGADNSGIMFLADATPSGGSTRMDIYG
ncbi:MAG: hypothetical protein KJN93_04210, partial [Alphaproteobacteria bacterium]|nr:hypothetical protein [Alphaproteobacteria bacterium]